MGPSEELRKGLEEKEDKDTISCPLSLPNYLTPVSSFVWSGVPLQSFLQLLIERESKKDWKGCCPNHNLSYGYKDYRGCHKYAKKEEKSSHPYEVEESHGLP